METNLLGLSQGKIYFIVTFFDEELTIPIVQTLKFLEEGKRSNGKKYFLFTQLLPKNETKFIVEEDHLAELVVNGAGLLDKLTECFNNIK